MTPSRRGSLAVLCAALLWSTGGFFIKSVSLDAWGVSFWRSLFAAITLYIVYRFMPQRPDGKHAWWSRHVLTGAVAYAVLLVLFVIATKLTTSANAIFLQYTAPIYLVFIEPWMSGVKRRPADLLSVAITTMAMGLFFLGKLDTHSLWGNISALASGMAFASYTLILKHDSADAQSRWEVVILGHALISLAAAGLACTGYTHLVPGPGDMPRLLFLGVVQIGLAYACFTWGIHYVRALDATLICMAEPVLNPIWVFIGLGEQPGVYAIVGGAIILLVSLMRTVMSR